MASLSWIVAWVEGGSGEASFAAGLDSCWVTADLGTTTHLYSGGQWTFPLVRNSLLLFSSIFSSSPVLGWLFWLLWFTWGRSTLPSLELLFVATSDRLIHLKATPLLPQPWKARALPPPSDCRLPCLAKHREPKGARWWR